MPSQLHRGRGSLRPGRLTQPRPPSKLSPPNNHFTWVRVQPTTLVVQAGRRVEPKSIGEGDKLLCQGTWVNDAWGPIFQAKRVEIIGRISDAGLQERVAAACQNIAHSGSSGSDGSSFSEANTGSAVDRQGQDLQDYLAALQDPLRCSG